MEEVLENFLMNDQPATCPNCGSRTDFEEFVDDESKILLQSHQCLDISCLFKFQAVES